MISCICKDYYASYVIFVQYRADPDAVHLSIPVRMKSAIPASTHTHERARKFISTSCSRVMAAKAGERLPSLSFYHIESSYETITHESFILYALIDQSAH